MTGQDPDGQDPSARASHKPVSPHPFSRS